MVKCEPWNSVKITFDLSTEAAQRLSELAELASRGDDSTLRQLGILSLQLQGGQVKIKIHWLKYYTSYLKTFSVYNNVVLIV